MGRNPPMFTEMRVLRQSCDDDHLVCTYSIMLDPCLCMWSSWLQLQVSAKMRFCCVIIAGFGIRDEFCHSWWYECNTCREANEKVGFWNGDKVAYYRHACWREGMDLDFSHWSTTECNCKIYIYLDSYSYWNWMTFGSGQHVISNLCKAYIYFACINRHLSSVPIVHACMHEYQ